MSPASEDGRAGRSPEGHRGRSALRDPDGRTRVVFLRRDRPPPEASPVAHTLLLGPKAAPSKWEHDRSRALVALTEQVAALKHELEEERERTAAERKRVAEEAEERAANEREREEEWSRRLESLRMDLEVMAPLLSLSTMGCISPSGPCPAMGIPGRTCPPTQQQSHHNASRVSCCTGDRHALSVL